jgi:uncharacterized membrane protein
MMTQAETNEKLNQTTSNVVVWFARHWLAIINLMWGVYLLLPFLAPFLLEIGLVGPARIIYSVYGFFCHQLPDHSYFLYSAGQEVAPTAASLQAGGMPAGLSLFQERRFLGNAEVGYKVAICQRDVAIYGSIFLAGISYGLLRGRVRGINWKIFALLTLPMAVDGLTQMFGWRESTWLLRSITGAIFGFAAVWLLYPFIQEAMDDVIFTEEQRWNADAADGANPGSVS